MRDHEPGPIRTGAAGPSTSGTPRPSCAECRRLKVRCNRTVPCSSCLRRGCGHICPNGTLVTGQGHRAFWASTQELRQNLSTLARRVRALEDALTTATPGHALLTDELRALTDPFLRDSSDGVHPPNGEDGMPTNSHEGVKDEEEEEEGVLDAAGSLSVGPDGRTAYIGHEANSWWFMHPAQDDEEDVAGASDAVRRALPPHVFAATDMFPLSLVLPHMSAPAEQRIPMLRGYLPSADQAAAIRQYYYDYVASVWNPIPRDEFDELIFMPFYSPSHAQPTTPGDASAAPRLAILFMVLAMGSVSNPTGALQLVNSEKYYRLACASILGSEAAEQPSIEAIQALHLMNLYLYYYSTPSPKSMNVGYLLNGMVVKLAHAIGLHRDPKNFQLSAKEMHRRRMLMCHLYTWDLGAALTLSRPPTLTAPHFDVKHPYTNDPPLDSAYSAWKFSFVTECLAGVHAEAFGASAPSYAAITRLDRKTRDHPLPAVLRLPVALDAPDYAARTRGEPPALICQRHYAVIYRERVLLALHRSFFACTLRMHSDDPLNAPYGNSVTAACRSAAVMVMVSQHLYAQLPHATSRMWYVWNQVFSAAVILGTLVIHCPTLSWAPQAFQHLTTAFDLFSRLPADAAHTPLAVIKKIRERAYLSLNSHGISPTFASADLPGGASYPTPPSGNSFQEEQDPTTATLAAATLAAYPPPLSATPSTGSSAQTSPRPTMSPVHAQIHQQQQQQQQHQPLQNALHGLQLQQPQAQPYVSQYPQQNQVYSYGSPSEPDPRAYFSSPTIPAPNTSAAGLTTTATTAAFEADLAALLQAYPTTDASQDALRAQFLQNQTAFASYPEQSAALFDFNLQDLFEGWQP